MKPSELVKWREKRGLTQPQLGELLSVTSTTIYRWEKGLRGVPAFLPLALESLDRKGVKKKKVRKSKERRR